MNENVSDMYRKTNVKSKKSFAYQSGCDTIWKWAKKIQPKMATKIVAGNFSTLQHNFLCLWILIAAAEVNCDVYQWNDIWKIGF